MVWVPKQGWVRKLPEREATYENLGDGWVLLLAIMRWYPDFVLDLFRKPDAEFELTFTHRMLMRINSRYKDVAITACRGAGKSYTTQCIELVEGIVWPGQQTSIVAPTIKQGAEIEAKIYKQVENNYPGLTNLYQTESNSTVSGRFVLSTPYGTEISIGSFRGNTIHKAIAEETAQEEQGRQFDSDSFKSVVIPAIRARYRIANKIDPVYVRSKVHSITSAGRRQQYAYELREKCRKNMLLKKSAFYIDIPYDVLLLEQMRDVEWAESIRDELTIAGWMREMSSIYSGSDVNPVVRDEHLTQARDLMCMEEHSCLKDKDNKLKPHEVIYIVANDVSYADGKNNAKNAVVVLKLTSQQNDPIRRDKYRKDVVWIEDWTPAETPTSILHARRLKNIWKRYCYPDAKTYIVIDAWQYGTSVVQALMSDLGDGLQPLCTISHNAFEDLELEHALPVIYPMKAGGAGAADPDADMVLNAEQQFENGNVHLLTKSMREGVAAYKKLHRIKTDEFDGRIATAYKKTNELVYQIQNLREEVSGVGIKEKRLNWRIQRDSWSALKYALRYAQILERSLVKKKKQNSWSALMRQAKAGSLPPSAIRGSRTISRIGGKRF